MDIPDHSLLDPESGVGEELGFLGRNVIVHRPAESKKALLFQIFQFCSSTVPPGLLADEVFGLFPELNHISGYVFPSLDPEYKLFIGHGISLPVGSAAAVYRKSQAPV